MCSGLRLSGAKRPRPFGTAAIEYQIDNAGPVGGRHVLKGRGGGRLRGPTPFQGVPPSDIMNLTVNKRGETPASLRDCG